MTKDSFYTEVDKGTSKIFNKMSLNCISPKSIEDFIHSVSMDLLRNIKASQIKSVEVGTLSNEEPLIVFLYNIRFKDGLLMSFLKHFVVKED